MRSPFLISNLGASFGTVPESSPLLSRIASIVSFSLLLVMT